MLFLLLGTKDSWQTGPGAIGGKKQNKKTEDDTEKVPCHLCAVPTCLFLQRPDEQNAAVTAESEVWTGR